MSDGGRWRWLLRDLRQDRKDTSSPLPDRISKYSILKEIQHTGSSIVYLAQDADLGRPVAIKVLRYDRSLPEFISRFEREGRIAASLRHPHVITIHDVGRWEIPGGGTVPYIVMDYVPGGTLRHSTLPFSRIAEIGAIIAEAVQYAHSQGVIHRDLKPDNVLLDQQGNPIVTDFGLAKFIQPDLAGTQEGILMGTPQYMAPEQIRADSTRVDERTDVYALGAILYELLTHAPPHIEVNPADLFQKILHEDPLSPSLRVPDIPRDLETVVLKALEKDPARRYPSAGALAGDLRRIVAGVPVEARPRSILERVWRRVLRNRAVLVPALLLLLLAALAGGLTLAARSRRLRAAIAEGLEWEQKGESLKARDAYRRALELDEGNREAGEGFERVDAFLRGSGSREQPLAAGTVSPRWVEIGGSAREGGLSASPGPSIACSLALAAGGIPVVAWHELSDRSIRLERWDGERWTGLGGSDGPGGLSQTTGPARKPSLALDSAGNPTVAWDDQSSGHPEIYLKRWNGAAWEELGGSASGGGVSQSSDPAEWPSLAVGSSGRPFVAWENRWNGHFQIRLRYWDGSSWVGLGSSARDRGISEGPEDSLLPSLALDRSDRPSVAWLGMNGGRARIHFRRWQGARWEVLGSPSMGDDFESHGLDGWLSDRPWLALDPDGNPIVAWRGGSISASTLYLRRWQAGEWRELGPAASPGGVGGTAARCEYAVLATDAAGNPVVAWDDARQGPFNVYLRRWDGTSWIELGGSSTGGGVSQTAGSAGNASLALDATGNPVLAWSEYVPAGSPERIFLRRFEETPPGRLEQFDEDGRTPLRRGSIGRGAVVFLSGELRPAAGRAARLQVEVRPHGVPFAGTITGESAPASTPERVSVRISGLPAGAKDWRARMMDSLGMVSAWIPFDAAGEGEPDFRVAGPR